MRFFSYQPPNSYTTTFPPSSNLWRVSMISENEHQFQHNDRSQPLDVIVGVDIGTSFTKVVVNVPFYAGEPAFAVPFGELADESLKYLIPTQLFIDEDRRCSLAYTPGASFLKDIKLGLMNEPNKGINSASGPPCDASSITVSVAYLALVLRYVRRWFIADKRNVFGEYYLEWSCNLGLPADVDDNEKLRDAFCISHKAAWLASRRPGPITVDDAQEAIDDVMFARYESEEMPVDSELRPEVIAEVAGYANSPLRNEGLHLLVDIGASTLDVCSFNLGPRQHEGDDRVPILTAHLELLGVEILRQRRGTEAERRFRNDCKQVLTRTIGDLRRKRDPWSRCWNSTLPVFLCGGGSVMRAYQDVVSDAGEWLQRWIRSSDGIRQIQLPKPNSLDAEIDDKSYHRLAVAWGLSQASFKIGKYERPSEIDDIEPLLVREKPEYIGQDMV